MNHIIRLKISQRYLVRLNETAIIKATVITLIGRLFIANLAPKNDAQSPNNGINITVINPTFSYTEGKEPSIKI